MPRIQRTAPDTTIPPPVSAPRRMMRVSNPGRADTQLAAAQAKALQAIDNHLQLIAIAQNKIDYLRDRIQPDINKEQIEIDRLKGVLEAELKAAKLPGYTNGQWEAKFEDIMAKASRTIDVAKVQKALAPADFLKVVKVLVTDLKTVMSEREINNVSTTIEAHKTGERFVVQSVVTKKVK
jgi:hypothetical protein